MSEKVERLVNLTIALLETRRPLTFQELRTRTTLYPQSDQQTARRMFERDKAELRSLGVPIEVRAIPLSDEEGYLVDRRQYELPDVDLTAEEIAALALALRLTDHHDAVALAAVAARAPDPVQVELRPSTRVVVGDAPIEPVADAVLSRMPIRFRYRTAAGQERERRLDPYAVVKRRGAWYLVGRDHDRDALRAFRMDRIQGRPAAAGEPGAFERPGDLEVARAVSGPEAAGLRARLAVAPSAVWSVRSRGGRPTGERFGERTVEELDGLDPYRDVPWLLGLGDEVVVLDPPELRDAVVAGLRATVEANA